MMALFPVTLQGPRETSSPVIIFTDAISSRLGQDLLESLRDRCGRSRQTRTIHSTATTGSVFGGRCLEGCEEILDENPVTPPFWMGNGGFPSLLVSDPASGLG